ncbi:MAG TPA: hypothetical protein VFQ53_22490 [Kofleriaceae bacterium]|nr:hypothetical protein [Kofleriaceae bacterium]
MRTMTTWSIAFVFAACAGPQSRDRPASGNPAAHVRETATTATVAPERPGARGPLAYTCGDTVLSDQSTSGGERLMTTVPCWDVEEEAAITPTRRVTVRPASEARDALASAELVQCKGIPEQELTHSPLEHRRAIAEIVPHRRGGQVRGVRIVLRPVPGLTAPWMEQAIACHRARWEVLGKPADYMADDPTLVDDAEIRVTRNGDHVEVLVVSDDPAQAQLAMSRAQQLAAERTATR